MASALKQLLAGAAKERDALKAEIAKLDARRAELVAEVDEYDRILGAANGTKKAAPKKPKRADWRVSSASVEQLYDAMSVASQNGKQQFTIKELVELSGLSEPTTHKSMHMLHEQGRVKVVGKHRQQRFWGVVV